LFGKTVSEIMLTLLLLMSMLTLVFNIQPSKASGTIYIRADGSVDPSTAPVQHVGNVYTFTDNISETIEVQKDSITIDGNGYTLQHVGELYGLYLNDKTYVTMKNLNINGFDYGIWLSRSSYNQIVGNNLTNNYNGIYITLFSNDNTIKDNNITDNEKFGVSIVGDSIENVVYHNNFIDNAYQHASSERTTTWDNGVQGNYWDNYSGVDSDGNGIGDTPYVIDPNNQDRYPFMATIPEFPSFLILPLFMIATLLAVIVYGRKHSMQP
jgi:parallel beta-helix repeat protein